VGRRWIRSLALLSLSILGGCDWSDLPGYWKTFEHPTYRFTVNYPRTWVVETSGSLGAAAVFRTKEKDPLFRANANVVVQQRKPGAATLEQEAKVTYQVLRMVMNEYRLLSQAPVRLGNIDAHELRGKYKAAEGFRIIRTILGVTEDRSYVFTFTCREEEELTYAPLVKKMLDSFRAPGSLSRPS
jgi:hypothetical protein